MVFETREDVTSPLINFSDLTYEGIIKYAVMQTLRLQTEDTERFALSVENIESLVLDELEQKEIIETVNRGKGKEPHPTYFEDLDKKLKDLETLYGRRDDKHLIKIRELAQFKFRLLMRHIKQKIPLDMVGII